MVPAVRILVLGGTRFVGFHITRQAAEAHEVTVFNRCLTPFELPVARRKGNRTASKLSALAEGTWDAVIDTSATTPRTVTEALEALAGRYGHYTLVSTSSVYTDVPGREGPVDEDSPRRQIDNPDTDVVTNKSYGALNALCEDAAAAATDGGALILRPVTMSGPRDYTGRLSFWARRATTRRVLLGPSRPHQPVQLLDVRDHARFVVSMAEQQASGIYNVTPATITFADLVAACAGANGNQPEVAWAPEGFLEERKVKMPLTVAGTGEKDARYRISGDKAQAAGLLVRNLSVTASDLLAWERANPKAERARPGLSAAREDELLAEFR